MFRSTTRKMERWFNPNWLDLNSVPTTPVDHGLKYDPESHEGTNLPSHLAHDFDFNAPELLHVRPGSLA